MSMVIPSEPARSDGSGPPRVPQVLLVVDEADLATTCRRYLEHLGYAARVAPDAAAAHEILDTAWADLVILDLQLARSGEALARLTRLAAPPALVCTGRASELARQQALAAGAAAYLAKPFSLEELRAAVERGLAARQGSAPHR